MTKISIPLTLFEEYCRCFLQNPKINFLITVNWGHFGTVFNFWISGQCLEFRWLDEHHNWWPIFLNCLKNAPLFPKLSKFMVFWLYCILNIQLLSFICITNITLLLNINPFHLNTIKYPDNNVKAWYKLKVSGNVQHLDLLRKYKHNLLLLSIKIIHIFKDSKNSNGHNQSQNMCLEKKLIV